MTDKIITVLGQTNFRGQHREFGIYDDDRRRHIYVIGKTGVGKTTFMENMVAQDIVAGKGVCFVDPHGDSVQKLLDMVPPERINDVVYFDPSDVDYPIAFNVLEAVDPSYKYLVASGLVSSLKKIWADSWGPRLEYILRNTILALLDYPSSTILGILRMLSDKGYRNKVIDKISDPVVKSFWINEFAQYNERFRSEAISPIQNKVGQLLSSAIIRNIMAQPKSTIDMHHIMNEGKILLVNVSKGKIGEDNSALLGAMLINRIQLAAMDRASILEEDRRDFYLYVDEFQNFATESFADILSEARKYRLNLTMAHQYIAQMEEEVQDAVFGNVGTLISFRVGAADAEYLEQEFAPYFMQTDLVNLDKYSSYIKLMINGISSKPFSMQTLPPMMEHVGRGDIVRRVSRERYGRSRTIVEDKVKRWSGVTLGDKEKGERAIGGEENKRPTRLNRQPVQPKLNERDLVDVVIKPAGDMITDLSNVLTGRPNTRGLKGNQEAYSVVCKRCQKLTTVPFKPDPDRDVFCRDCLLIVKEERKYSGRSLGAAAPREEKKVENMGDKKVSVFTGPKPPPLP